MRISSTKNNIRSASINQRCNVHISIRDKTLMWDSNIFDRLKNYYVAGTILHHPSDPFDLYHESLSFRRRSLNISVLSTIRKNILSTIGLKELTENN